MAKRPVVIQEVPAEVAAQIADEMAERMFAEPTAEPTVPHINVGREVNLGPRRPSELPPKAFERPFTIEND